MPVLTLFQSWLDLILDGRKTLEIRGSSTSKPGQRILLCASKTFQIFGAVDLVECFEIETDARFVELSGEHLVEGDRRPYRRTYAWRVANPERFSPPIPYASKPRGAVVWSTFA